MNSENRNFILAIVLSMAVMLVYSWFFERNVQPQKNLAQQEVTVERTLPVQKEVLSREEALKQDARIAIKTPKLKGTIRLNGGYFDDLELLHYKQNVQKGSPDVVLLSPSAANNGYFIECGWMGFQAELFPTASTLWSTAQKELSPGNPVTLTWTNQEGTLFERIIEVDEDYLFKVTEKVTNRTEKTFDIAAWAAISRIGTPNTSDYMVLHEGALGVLNGKLKEFAYTKLKEEKTIENKKVSGWFGFTDKYWLTSLIPQENTLVDMQFKSGVSQGKDVYQVEYTSPKVTLKPGESHKTTHRIFAGAKVVSMLDAYEEKLGIVNFDLAVDFGWFYFLTKPLFYVLNMLYNFLGNFGWAIVIVTVITKLLMFPLANKSFNSMNRMKLLQPEMERLKAKYADDKVRMQQELMEFYKKNKINPLGGCLPLLIQIPIGFALYKVLFVSIEMRHAPFFGWIQDLSAPDPTSFLNLFGLLPFAAPEFLMIGIWPLILGVTMFLQQKMSPQPGDPMQAKMMMLMPIFFVYLFASFPAGIAIYWAWSNILTIVQQWWQGKTIKNGA